MINFRFDQQTCLSQNTILDFKKKSRKMQNREPITNTHTNMHITDTNIINLQIIDNHIYNQNMMQQLKIYRYWNEARKRSERQKPIMAKVIN